MRRIIISAERVGPDAYNVYEIHDERNYKEAWPGMSRRVFASASAAELMGALQMARVVAPGYEVDLEVKFFRTERP
jgi:hypothetical protein